MKTELYRLGGDPQAREMLQILASDKQLGRVQKGERLVDTVDVGSVDIDVDETLGQYPEVQLRVCVDVSEMDIVDAKTGRADGGSSGKQKFVSHGKLWHYEDAWHVVSEETPDKNATC